MMGSPTAMCFGPTHFAILVILVNSQEGAKNGFYPHVCPFPAHPAQTTTHLGGWGVGGSSNGQKYPPTDKNTPQRTKIRPSTDKNNAVKGHFKLGPETRSYSWPVEYMYICSPTASLPAAAAEATSEAIKGVFFAHAYGLFYTGSQTTHPPTFMKWGVIQRTKTVTQRTNT
jgi:hypothetical protein